MQFHRALGVAALLVTVGISLGVLLWKGYISTPWTREMPGRAATLAPGDWLRYSTETWSIAYPDDWTSTEDIAQNRVTFQPSTSDGTTTYFTVTESDLTYVAAKRWYETTSDAYKSTDVVIANYIATKYDFGSGRVDYVIDYPERVVVLSTDVPDNDDVGIVFATFVFLK